MAQSIKKLGSQFLLLAFNPKKRNKLINPNIFSDPMVKKVFIAKGDPDLVTPLNDSLIEWYTWGFITAVTKVPIELGYSIGDALWSMKDFNLTFDPTPHLTLSHMFSIKTLKTEEGTEKQVTIYSLSDVLSYSMLFGDIKQVVHHKSGKVISK